MYVFSKLNRHGKMRSKSRYHNMSIKCEFFQAVTYHVSILYSISFYFINICYNVRTKWFHVTKSNANWLLLRLKMSYVSHPSVMQMYQHWFDEKTRMEVHSRHFNQLSKRFVVLVLSQSQNVYWGLRHQRQSAWTCKWRQPKCMWSRFTDSESSSGLVHVSLSVICRVGSVPLFKFPVQFGSVTAVLVWYNWECVSCRLLDCLSYTTARAAMCCSSVVLPQCHWYGWVSY